MMFSTLVAVAPLAIALAADAARFAILLAIPRAAARAENVFLRKQLALYVERGVRPRRATDREKLALIILARFFDWCDSLVVTPRTFKSWQQAIERSFWRWISRRRGDQTWSTFIRNHAKGVVACDFCAS